MANRGRFRPRNPEKYDGDIHNIIYRSSWELKVMMRLDKDPNIILWGSECKIIPYNDRSTGRIRRYFPDFHYKRVDGKKFLVEVKPFKETVPPVKGRNEKRFIAECLIYSKNMSKWAAAERWCEKYGYTFIKITENELGV